MKIFFGWLAFIVKYTGAIKQQKTMIVFSIHDE